MRKSLLQEKPSLWDTRRIVMAPPGAATAPAMEQSWLSYGTVFGFLALLHTLISTFLPPEVRDPLTRFGRKVVFFFFSYVDFRVEEYDGASMNELYSAVQLHLSQSSAKTARSVNLALPKNATAITYSLAENERTMDTFQGSQVWWEFSSAERKQATFSWDNLPDEKRSLRLRVHKKDREKIVSRYVQHILAHAKEIKLKSRDRLLYTNLKSREGWGGHKKVWDSVPFKHPSTFETLAIDPEMKKKITEDLTDFANGEEFYKRAGRAWKRGYLLYGPPGTGKSSMIAAMANFLEYDVYDMELTEVKSNAALRNLLIKTNNKSIIVIEDIDCSLDLSDREKKAKKKKADEAETKPPDPNSSETNEASQVTLSGLLNFTDGLWSCCGSERIFVFTTNHIEKLDPALLRSGRMDMHIHLSYCSFEAFKVLAKNYLGIEEHDMFEEVRAAMAEEGVEMTPADVSEVLTREKRDTGKALRYLVRELRESKAKRLAAAKLKEEEKAAAAAPKAAEAHEPEEEAKREGSTEVESFQD